jgi:hypothetical protein
VISRRVDGPYGSLLVHVAGPLDDVRGSTAVLAASLTVAVPAVAALLAGLVWWLVGRTLRPVEAIRAEVAEIGAMTCTVGSRCRAATTRSPAWPGP